MKKLFCLALPALLLAANEANADAKADLLSAFDKAYAKGEYIANVVTNTGKKNLTSTIKVKLPGSFHISSEGSETIVLPSGTWVNAGGQWMQLPINMSQMVQNVSIEAYKTGASMVQEVREVGSRNVAGCDSKIYAYRASGKVMGMRSDADMEVAVCQSNGLPVQTVSVEKKTTSTITFDYDTPFEIRRP